MSIIERIVRMAFPTLMASAAGRRLPSRIVPLLKGSARHEFLAALKTVNLERLRAAEERGETRDLGAYPSFITVAGTSRCNVRCEFCINQWDALPDGSNRPHMKPEHIEAVIDELFPYVRKLALSVSGEPLYDPHFELLVRKAGEYDIFVEFTTNAMLVSKPGLLDLILDNVHRVNVSFDGATQRTYERLRGGSKFDKVTANVKLMTAGRRARGKSTPEFNMRYILMKDTIDELPLMVDLAKDLGVDHLFTNHLQVFIDELADQSLVHHKQRANAAFARTRERAAARGMVVVLPDDFAPDDPAGAQPATATAVLEPPPSTGIDAHTASLGPSDESAGDTWAASGAVARSVRRPDALPKSAYEGHCPYIYDQAFFEADGSIFPCCNSGGIALGHLDKADDFYSIWTNDAYASMRATMYTPRCHDICVNCYLREGSHASAAYIRPVEGAARGGW